MRLAKATYESDPRDPPALGRELPLAAQRTDTLLRGIRPIGDDLESVYAYLHERARGQAR